MFAGFKKFIVQGNAIDLAVGVIIGAAFKAVVDALVASVISPLIAGIFGKPNFDDVLNFTIRDGNPAKDIAPTVVKVGALITQSVNFLLVAIALYFLIVAPINHLNERRKRGEEPADEKSNEDRMVELLEQIANK